MTETEEEGVAAGPPPAPGAHFLNNVLAAAASYVDDDPRRARELLAELGAFLAYRLREDLRPVALRDELEFVRTYLRLEEGRFPDRVHAEVAPPAGDGPQVVPLSVQAPVQEAVGRRLRDRPAPLRVKMRPFGDDGAVRLDLSDHPDGDAPERVVLPVGRPA